MLPRNMRQDHPAPRTPRPRIHGTRAFTLTELAVVALIIGLLAAIAVPSLKRSVVAARSDAVINDLRVFSGAFLHYMQEKGDWPEDSAPGDYPLGMEQFLRSSAWTKPSAIGGLYNWEPQTMQGGVRVRAAITISSVDPNLVTSDRIQLEDIDRRFDDGNLSTGLFRLGFGLEPLYIIEP